MTTGNSITRAQLLLTAAVFGVLAVACDTAAAPPPPRTRAVAFARAVNLVASDVPTLTRATTAPSSVPASAIEACAGSGPGQRPLLRAPSPNFERGTLQSVNSTVTVLIAPTEAAGYVTEFDSARGKACFRQALTRGLQAKASPGVRYGRASLSVMPQPATGSDGSFKARYRVAVSRGKFSIRLYLDLLGFRLGSTVVTLAADGPALFPPSEEQRLISLLLARAKANRL